MLERRSVPTVTSLTFPLAALGTVTALVYLKTHVGRVFRKVINLFDPILPSHDFVVASVYGRPLLSPVQVEQHIKENDNAVVSGAERTVVWADETKRTKMELCVVFLHGWGACRQECRPIPELIAKALNANLYCGRLPGHGRRHARGRMGGGGPDGDTLVQEANAHAIFLSAIDALRIGLSLGEKVVLVGMSTGGVLMTWLSSLQATQSSIAALVLISPAYALGHPLYPVLKHTFSSLRLFPFFGDIIRAWLISAAIGGKTKTSPILSEEHNRYNSLTYPSRAILHLLDVLWELEIIDHAHVTAPTIMIGNPQDHVVNFRVKAIDAFLRFGDAPKVLYCVTRAEHPHVIASEMLSPSTVSEISHAAIVFLRENITSAATFLYQDDNARKKPRTTSVVNRISSFRSVPTGLSHYASFPSMADLTSPLQA